MSIATRPNTAVKAETTPTTVAARRDWAWTVSGLIAAALMAVAAFSPLWVMKLTAPQYPDGLTLTAYGTRMDGDLAEINELNHYIGIRAIQPDSVTELKLFPFVMAALVVAVVAGAVFVRGWRPRAVLAAAVWSIPIGMLIDMQWWLYSYGHDIDHSAPLRVAPFTPRVLGATKVMNFNSDAMVASGFWLMVAAAVVVSVAPWLVRFLWTSWNNTGDEAKA